jgi:hypothetical protein
MVDGPVWPAGGGLLPVGRQLQQVAIGVTEVERFDRSFGACACHRPFFDRDALTVQMVEGLADRWGVEGRPPGKVVWFEVSR